MDEIIKDLQFVKDTLIKYRNLELEMADISSDRKTQKKIQKIATTFGYIIKYMVPIIILLFLEKPYKSFFADVSNIIYASTGGIFGFTAVQMFSFANTIFLIVFLATFLYCVYKIIVKTTRFSKQFAVSDKNHYEPLLDEIEAKLHIMEKNEFVQINKIIARDYWNVNILDKLINYLSVGRASSLKEALNLFEEEKSRAKLERQLEGISDANALSSIRTERKIEDLKKSIYHNTKKF